MVNIVKYSGWADTYQELLDYAGELLDGTIVKILEMEPLDYYLVWDAQYETWIKYEGPLSTKQDVLVVGENIKYINGYNPLGSGSIAVSGREINLEDDTIEAIDPTSPTEFTVDPNKEFYFIKCTSNNITANFDLASFGKRKVVFIRVDNTAFKFYINDISGTFTVNGNPVPYNANGFYTASVVSDGVNLFIH